MPTWDQLKSKYKNKINFVKVTLNDPEADANEINYIKELMKRLKVSGFPTIFLLNSNQSDILANPKLYNGNRSFEDFESFIKNN